MAIETPLSVLRMLEQHRPLPLVSAIYGPQPFLREYVLDAIRSKMVREGRRQCVLQIAPGGNFDAVIEEIRDADLFIARKVVACRIARARRGRDQDPDGESEDHGGAKGSESMLAEAIEQGKVAGELILLYERDSAPAKIRRVVERAGWLVNCLRPFDNQLGQYAQAFARALGLKLDPGAGDGLISRYGSDLAAMANALAKAGIHREKGARIGPADLLDPGPAPTPELFDLAESLGRGQIAPTLAIFERAISLGRDVFEVLAVEIIPVVRRMLLAAVMLEQGNSAAEISSAMGFSSTSGLFRRALEGAQRFGPDRLRRMHQRVCDLDAEFKMGLRREREAAVSQALVELMAN